MYVTSFMQATGCGRHPPVVSQLKLHTGNSSAHRADPIASILLHRKLTAKHNGVYLAGLRSELRRSELVTRTLL